MKLRSWFVLAMATLLAACASAPKATLLVDSGLWLDQAFGYDSKLVTVDEDALFRLDDDVLVQLRNARAQTPSLQGRLKYLVDTVVINKQRPFAYVSNSTVASQTWRTRAGDCLSLTVLTYAMARELGLPATLQELDLYPVFDRRAGVDYRVGHVNVYVERPKGLYETHVLGHSRGVVIDFEPTYDSARIGNALSSQGILARYYNNLGAQYLASQDHPRAYAHFKAAVQADPQFSAARTNLAGLYLMRGFSALAERVLTETVHHTENSDGALVALHRLLQQQGRSQEAAQYQAMLEARQKLAPYYWIRQGVDQLQARNFRQAVDALEKAQSLTTGFSEVHRYLALAYLQSGKPDKAQEQIATLARIDNNDPSVGQLNRKILAARKAKANAEL
jgi:tetratricopeptide (TPR) repeat protein